MADYIDLPFIGAAYKGRSVDQNAQELVNWYPEVDNKSSKTPISLMPTPGALAVKSVGAGSHRSSLEFKGKAYFVVGSELIEMDTNENYSSVGNLSTSAGNVSMASNGTQGDQLVLVDGTNGYLWDGATLSTITFGFSISPEFIVFIDSYFIVNDSNTGRFYRSAINDGTSWSALDFATAERDPDNLRAIIVNQRQLWLLGDVTTEVWGNDGSDFKFSPIPNAFNEWGVVAPFSVAKADGSVFWITNNKEGEGFIARSEGYGPKIISTRALEYILQTYSTLEDAVGYTYQQAGHTFYVLNFTSANKTWVYDLSTDMWHERTSTVNDTTGRHLGQTHLFFNKKHYIGSYSGGDLFTFDLDTYLDNGNPIKRKRITQHIAKERKRIRYYQLELEFEGGVGLTSGQGSDPQVMLSWSDDGGHTYSNKRYAPIGKKGEYGYRVLFHQLGSSRDRLWKLETSDPVKYVLIKATAKVTESKN